MSRAQWEEAYRAQRARLERFPTRKHPAVSALIRRVEALAEYGRKRGYIAK
ncbi:hypothetical protein AOA12_06265 [Microbacterium sp. No. 7]|nr:hypothetical protein AOA12_06265 [Microbacterium sp. No. 7]